MVTLKNRVSYSILKSIKNLKPFTLIQVHLKIRSWWLSYVPLSIVKKYNKVKIRVRFDFTFHTLEKAVRLLHKLPLKTLTNLKALWSWYLGI